MKECFGSSMFQMHRGRGFCRIRNIISNRKVPFRKIHSMDFWLNSFNHTWLWQTFSKKLYCSFFHEYPVTLYYVMIWVRDVYNFSSKTVVCTSFYRFFLYGGNNFAAVDLLSVSIKNVFSSKICVSNCLVIIPDGGAIYTSIYINKYWMS